MDLVTSFVVLLQQVAFVFTAPTFNSFLTVLTGWVFARRRVVTRMIEAADAVEDQAPSAFHRVFSAARWSLDELGLAIFILIEPWLDGDSALLSLDDTLARKRGLKIFGVGMHHDPLLSTRKTALTNWGHSWVVLRRDRRVAAAPRSLLQPANPVPPVRQQEDRNEEAATLSHPAGVGGRTAGRALQTP